MAITRTADIQLQTTTQSDDIETSSYDGNSYGMDSSYRDKNEKEAYGESSGFFCAFVIKSRKLLDKIASQG